jgi:hypothetical protein
VDLNFAKEDTMILSIFTVFHVILSLVGIAAGFVVVCGLLSSRQFEGWTTLFLASMVLTSVTGFFFPVQHFMPSHGVGIVSLIVLAIAIAALYLYHLAGGWRRTYVITTVLALYLNVFVLIVQLFRTVPAIEAIAPTQSEPTFQMTQLAALLLFAALGVGASMKFQGEQSRMAKA